MPFENLYRETDCALAADVCMWLSGCSGVSESSAATLLEAAALLRAVGIAEREGVKFSWAKEPPHDAPF